MAFGLKPVVPEPFSGKCAIPSDWMVDLQTIRKDLDWFIRNIGEDDACNYETGNYHLNSVRMLVGFVLRELKGGVSPYMGLERQRSYGTTTEVAPPADLFDREGYQMPEDPLQRLDHYRRYLMALRDTLKVLRNRYQQIDTECGIFLERAVVECELASAWLGYTGYPHFRDEN